MGEFEIGTDDPRAADVRTLLERHLAVAGEHSPPEDVHALDVDRLVAGNVSFFSLRSGSMEAFAAARALYASVGFIPCGPFDQYEPSRNSAWTTLELGRPDS